MTDKIAEKWESITGFEGRYMVSTFGRIKSKKRRGTPDRIIKPQAHRLGYLKVWLWDGGEKRGLYIHRLVADAFLRRPSPKKLTVNHKNGIKTDNSIENLEYCTLSENILHAFKTGLRCNAGSNHPSHKLTERDVLKIRSSGEKVAKLAAKFKVSIDTIYSIRRNKIWRHV